MKKYILLALFGLSFVSCTENIRTRNFGGTQTIEVDGKVLNVTWKEGGSIWILSRQKKEGEVSETLIFKEKSPHGLLEGTVILKEK